MIKKLRKFDIKLKNWVAVLIVGLFVVLYSLFAPELIFVNNDGVVSLSDFNKEMEFYGNKIRVFVADEKDEMVKGLGGVEELPYGYGMLFVFGEWGRYGIWMKDMKIPIDIAWVDDEYKIVDYVKNVSPDTYPEVFLPSKDAFYVLEFPAGYLDSVGL